MTTTAPSSPGAGPAPAASDLSPDEQAALTAGADMWHTVGVDRLDLAGIGVTDGPSGARGSQFTGTSSTSLPCGTALASTWNRALIGRVGRLLGDEARSKGASVLLAPTVNIHRHPLGGRNFECYSEDPYLTAEIAVAFIEGVQSRGVACAVKHFACNDQETDRMEIDSVVDERTRREIYYPPFEAAVRAGVWSVMAAYNRLDGIHCSQHPGLLTDLLRGEWGFDGVVVSDWFGVHSIDALAAGLDLEMPGPPQWLGAHVVAAVDAGDLDARVVQQAAERVLELVERTAVSRAAGAGGPVADPAQVARAAATEAIVLLSNDGVLPLAAAGRPSIALLGWRADQPEVQGGGSAQVTPPYVVTPLQGIVARAEEGTVTYEPGRPVPRSAPLTGRLLSPDGPGGGIELAYFAAGHLSGEPIRTESLSETTAVWLGEPAPDVPAGDFSARMTASFVPDMSGRWSVSVSAIGPTRLLLDGELLGDTADAPPGAGLMGLFTVPVVFEVDLVAGTEHAVVAEFDAPPALGPISLAGMTVAVGPPPQPDAVARAAQAAAAADVAVVVVGLDERVTEGQDSTTMDLPQDQISLIKAVAAANERTVVVVNAATPVTMDWAEDVAAAVQMSYLGQETGSALAAVLFGDADATGRLTTTYPVRLEDAPAYGHFPGGDGSVAYEEGVFVGYRHYDSKDIEPRWCFGHGLSYTTFAHSPLVVASDPAIGGAVVSVDVTNTGDRAGSEVVQVYVRHVDADVDRPDRELKGFEKVSLAPGETMTVTVPLDERAFAHWDPAAHDWRVPPATYEILVGSSSRSIHRTATWSAAGAVAAGT
jgi:beta-glucosidase